MHRQNLGDMLVAANLIDDVQMQVALAEQSTTGRKFGSTLVDLKFIDENVLAAFLSRQIDVPCISLLHIDIPKKVLRKLPARVARQCEAIPIRIEDGRLEIAMVDPSDIDLIEILEVSCGMTVTPLIAPQSSISKMVVRFYPDEDPEDQTTGSELEAPRATNPMFLDLIEEIESGDFETRLERIEEALGRMGSVLERILRNLERN
ncbi:MAG TPA: hypothetical protein VNM92_07710 [Thermoanaerobaculia bacterium]|nr:hypothetical protein [Thermoanaerobaculia bacterium]